MKPSSPDSPLEAAALWLARTDAGLSAAEKAEFQHWLEAAPAHAAAWAEVQEPWQSLDRARLHGHAPDMLEELNRRAKKRTARRRVWIGFAAAAVIAISLTAGLYQTSEPVLQPGVDGPVAAAEKPSAVAEPKIKPTTYPSALVLRPEQRRLDDGSVVELSEHALLSVNYTAERREVRLISGTAHFTVAHNPDRPFLVQAGAVEVRAVGTAFAVERSEQAADVLVTEGRVGVARTVEAEEAEAPLLVDAGGRVLMSYQADEVPHVEILSAEEMARRLQWRTPRLQLRGATLVEVVALLNQLNHTQMTIGDPDLEQLRFSGVFRADNAAGFVRLLENDHGVAVTYNGENKIVLHRK